MSLDFWKQQKKFKKFELKLKMSNEIFSSFGSINDYKNAKKMYN